MIQDEKLTEKTIEQYFQFKEKYPDTILFFHVGEFYEAFYEDAETCSKVLGLLRLNERRNPGGAPIPLVGMPVHYADAYLKRMLQSGYKVAVCEKVTSISHV